MTYRKDTTTNKEWYVKGHDSRNNKDDTWYDSKRQLKILTLFKEVSAPGPDV